MDGSGWEGGGWIGEKNKKEEWMIATEKPPQSSSSKKVG